METAGLEQYVAVVSQIRSAIDKWRNDPQFVAYRQDTYTKGEYGKGLVDSTTIQLNMLEAVLNKFKV